ncbi:MAG TPA: ComF family protein [Candidatus Protoclostridium stercorigallinarum]|uniref:ComF family protein n=1 Tax=Candidatus Protoclostridium stercorigallinarum TaxID=2838741 RepID=A0A9D1Q1W6_9FIRM|nr:ComF family protein [Candidatus Protoclostridium stercorigallinarum]
MDKHTLIKKAFAGIGYPEGITCAACNNELHESSRYGLCPDCLVPFISHCCKRCGTALAERGREYCDKCLHGGDYAFDAARAPFPYERESVHKLVWGLKYAKQPYYAGLMAVPMTEFLATLGWEFDAITFVPLHPKKEYKRTYNQSKLLAGHISEACGVPVLSTMKKTTYSKKSATSLGREDRARLLERSFEMLPGTDVKSKRLLLIDDVYTTGATANECAKTLKSAKAKAVYVLTYATSRGDRPITYDPAAEEEYIAKLRRMRSR